MIVNASIRDSTRARWERERQQLAALYDLLGEAEVETNTNEVASTLDVPPGTFQLTKMTFEEAGVLETRLEYRQGRHAFWRLPHPQSVALEMLDAFHRKEAQEAGMSVRARRSRRSTTFGKGAHPTSIAAITRSLPPIDTSAWHREGAVAVAERTSEDEPTAAVAGPEPESVWAPLKQLRRDDQEALIAAARQYRDRSQVVENLVRQAAEAGMHLPPESFRFEVNPTLEAIAMVLPTLERMGRTIENLTTQVERERDRGKPERMQIENLEIENRRLRELVERLTARVAQEPSKG
jgi:hypothetical protein